MLRPDTKLISVDDHIVEHPRVWLDRLASKWDDVAPRVIDAVHVDDRSDLLAGVPLIQWREGGVL
jgi:hypothetical protein